MATAKKAAGKAAAKKTAPRKASAAEVDDILGGDDVLAGKKGGKAAKKAAGKKGGKAPAKARGEGGTTEQVRTALSKLKKLTSYQDIAEATGFDIRLVRRTARAMDEEGAVERQKEGTVVYVKAKK